MRTTKYGNSSFCYVAAGVWNSLPNDLRKIEDFKEFRRLVEAWSGSSCKCSMCKKVNQFFLAFTYVLYDLILKVPSTIFQLNRDGSSWIEPVLS